MNEFRTEMIPVLKKNIDRKSAIITLGSCFSDAIGSKLKENKFETLVNPFGTVYNPISIHRLLANAIQAKYPTKETYLRSQDIYFNYDFHSRFFSSSEDDLVHQIKSVVDTSHQFLRKTRVIVITYGTSFVYQRNDNHHIVANCHKVPGKEFTKRLISSEEIVSSFKNLFDIIQEHISLDRIILTVSPVRHVKDTLERNNLSKAVLRVACEQIEGQFPSVEYFPSYEIMMDDLRDYRFYKRDLIHPTDQAEDYIWERFAHTYFSESTLKLLREWDGIQKAMAHRPHQVNGVSHQAFLLETIKRLEEIKPHFDVESEITKLKSLLGITT